jgi:hypothetical protein
LLLFITGRSGSSGAVALDVSDALPPEELPLDALRSDPLPDPVLSESLRCNVGSLDEEVVPVVVLAGVVPASLLPLEGDRCRVGRSGSLSAAGADEPEPPDEPDAEPELPLVPPVEGASSA